VADVVRFEVHVVCVDEVREDLADEEGWQAVGKESVLEALEACHYMSLMWVSVSRTEMIWVLVSREEIL